MLSRAIGQITGALTYIALHQAIERFGTRGGGHGAHAGIQQKAGGAFAGSFRAMGTFKLFGIDQSVQRVAELAQHNLFIGAI
jgi:hypothetical protein